MRTIKRPFNCFVFFWTLGLIGGTLYVDNIQGSPLFFILVFVISSICYYIYGKRVALIIGIAFLLGMLMLLMHPTTRQVGQFKEGDNIVLQGTVQEIQSTAYGQNLILNNLMIAEKSLRGKVQVQVSLSENFLEGERLNVMGKVLAFPTLMNPSDFDYGQYLRGKNIVSVIKAKSCVRQGGKPNNLIKIRRYLCTSLEKAFQGADEGIMQAALLGDDTALIDETKNLYSVVGIGHILCVSGFHVALIVGVLVAGTAYAGISYNKRYICVISGIWCYALLTGMATSTIRASIMATVVMLARILWEEEDFWTSIGLSVLLILIWSPYSIFNMGFQLSFSAVCAIGISQIYIQRWKKNIKGIKMRIVQCSVPWLIISIVTGPIIASYYYEIPFFSSVLNLLILPVFSVLIIMGWCVLGLQLVGIPLVVLLAKGVVVFLQVIRMLCEMMRQIPLGTICTGKPTVMGLIIYYGIVGLCGLWLYGIRLSKKCYTISMISVSLWLGGILLRPQMVQVTYLYVGQGDSSIIKTPHQKIIVIDGGPFGKGKVIERYIKYSGKKEVEALLVSHADSDHIGGIIELVQSDLKVGCVIVSKTDTSQLLGTLQGLCEERGIPVIVLGALDEFTIDKMNFNILAPTVKQSDINNNSLVCLAQYKNFKALFTGDKDKESESNVYNNIAPISLLKVSHHGSKTGTEEKLLLKLQPQYAMISCGINNRYGHPHEEVIEALTNCGVPYERTDLQGAIWVRTNGEKMNLYTQRERIREEE